MLLAGGKRFVGSDTGKTVLNAAFNKLPGRTPAREQLITHGPSALQKIASGNASLPALIQQFTSSNTGQSLMKAGLEQILTKSFTGVNPNKPRPSATQGGSRQREISRNESLSSTSLRRAIPVTGPRPPSVFPNIDERSAETFAWSGERPVPQFPALPLDEANYETTRAIVGESYPGYRPLKRLRFDNEGSDLLDQAMVMNGDMQPPLLPAAQPPVGAGLQNYIQPYRTTLAEERALGDMTTGSDSGGFFNSLKRVAFNPMRPVLKNRFHTGNEAWQGY